MILKVLSVGAWADVLLKPGFGEYARRVLTLNIKGTDTWLPQYKDHPAGGDRLYIPRGLVSECNIPVTGIWESLTVESKLGKALPYRVGQARTINEFLAALKAGNPYGGVLQGVTGVGKSVMGLDLACTLGLKTLIVVPRSSLMEQWKENILQWTTATEDDIGLVQGPSRVYIGKPFTIAMIHTLSQQVNDYPEGFYSAFGTTILDEVHVVPAESFSVVAPMFNCKYRIGLSATPYRKDKMDNVFRWHVGATLAKNTKYQAKPKVRIIPYRGTDTAQTGCVWGGRLNLGRYFTRLAKSPERTALVVKVICMLNVKNHFTLVLSDRTAQLVSIQELLVSAGVANDDIGRAYGKYREVERKIRGNGTRCGHPSFHCSCDGHAACRCSAECRQGTTPRHSSSYRHCGYVLTYNARVGAIKI
jgi:hypothetical protein